MLQNTSAQTKSYFGVKVGGNSSKTTRGEYSFTSPMSNKARFGLNLNSEIGLIANLPFNDSLSFQPEILLVKRGYKAYGIYNHADGTTNKESYDQMTNTYIDIPLLLKYTLGKKNARVFVAAGPAFSFITSSYYKTDQTGQNPEKRDVKISYRYHRTEPKITDSTVVDGEKKYITTVYDSITVKARPEISAVFATGFHYKIKKSLIIFDVRYIYGLRNKQYSYLEDDRALVYQKDFVPELQPIRREEFNRRLSVSISYLYSF